MGGLVRHGLDVALRSREEAVHEHGQRACRRGKAAFRRAVVAADIEGVAPQDAFDALSRLALGIGDDAEITTQTIAGREVTRIRPSADAPVEQVAYGLVGEDVVWFLVADEGHLEEVVASLP